MIDDKFLHITPREVNYLWQSQLGMITREIDSENLPGRDDTLVKQLSIASCHARAKSRHAIKPALARIVFAHGRNAYRSTHDTADIVLKTSVESLFVGPGLTLTDHPIGGTADVTRLRTQGYFA